jgi:hypothetical protein
MSRKRYTPEQTIGKLREAEVALSAINALFKRIWKDFVIQIMNYWDFLRRFCFGSDC